MAAIRDDALDFELALAARQIERRLQQRVIGDVREQFVHVIDADAREHLAAVGIGEGKIAHRRNL